MDSRKISDAMDKIDVSQLKAMGLQAVMGGATGRWELLDQVKEMAIAFLLDTLPTIKVPPIQGEKEQVKYT